MSTDPLPAKTKRARAPGVAPALLKGVGAAGHYAGVSEKIVCGWVKAGHLKPLALSRRLHLFRPADVLHAAELAAQAYAEATAQGQE